MFGGYSKKTKRTVRETGLARPARHQDFPRITEGEYPRPDVPHKRNSNPGLLLSALSSQTFQALFLLGEGGAECRLPRRAKDPALR